MHSVTENCCEILDRERMALNNLLTTTACSLENDKYGNGRVVTSEDQNSDLNKFSE